MDPTPDQIAILDACADFWSTSSSRFESSLVEIPVFFHIIRDDQGGGEQLTEEQVDLAISVLNDSYSESRYIFVKYFEGYQYVNNSAWVEPYPSRDYGYIDGYAEYGMKRELALDPARVLNVYACPSLPGGLLGWATFPDDYPEDSSKHGVVVLSGTFPNGSTTNYNKGDTLVHEVGHYLGLFHTFEGECDSEIGDAVDDTNRHKANYERDPETTDTCPEAEGTDPVHNFMNYVYDDWMDEFTPGQIVASHSVTEMNRPEMWDALPLDQAPSDLRIEPHFNVPDNYQRLQFVAMGWNHNFYEVDEVIVERRSTGSDDWHVFWSSSSGYSQILSVSTESIGVLFWYPGDGFENKDFRVRARKGISFTPASKPVSVNFPDNIHVLDL